MTVADRPRHRVYKADELTRAWASSQKIGTPNSTARVLEREWTPGDTDAVQRYVDRITDAEGATRLTVVTTKSTRYSTYYSGRRQIALARWGFRELVVLHEIAHHLTPGWQAHGPEFCAAYIDLVNRYSLGADELADVLSRNLLKAGARIEPDYRVPLRNLRRLATLNQGTQQRDKYGPHYGADQLPVTVLVQKDDGTASRITGYLVFGEVFSDDGQQFTVCGGWRGSNPLTFDVTALRYIGQ